MKMPITYRDVLHHVEKVEASAYNEGLDGSTWEMDRRLELADHLRTVIADRVLSGEQIFELPPVDAFLA